MEKFRRLVKIAFRNVFRNKRRSLLTLAIVILGCNGLIVIGGFFDNIMDGFRELYIHSQTGHLQVNLKGYRERGVSDPFEYLLKDVTSLQQKIEAMPHVLYTIPRIKFGGLVNNNNANVAVLTVGTDPTQERRMGSHRIENKKQAAIQIDEGSDLDAGDPKGVLLGKGLMKALGLKVGDTFSFITTQYAGALEGDEFKVRGAFSTIVKDFDDRAMKGNLDTVQKLLGVEDQAHSVVVLLDKTENTSLVQAQLEKTFKAERLPLEVISWEEDALFYRQAVEMFAKIFTTVKFIIAIIFFFSIANTINMALFERMREFGTMMAMGNQRSTVFSMIFLEACTLGLIGSALGVLTAIGSAYLISAVGIEMPPPPQGTHSYYAMVNLYPALLAETFLIAVVATLLSSLIPGYRASHFRITQALGYV